MRRRSREALYQTLTVKLLSFMLERETIGRLWQLPWSSVAGKGCPLTLVSRFDSI